jgi:hypothetical protein
MSAEQPQGPQFKLQYFQEKKRRKEERRVEQREGWREGGR